MKKESVKIEGMHCASCASSIESALKETVGVEDVTVNYGNETAYITYDEEEIDSEKVREIIRDTGYQVADQEHRQHASPRKDEKEKQRNNFLLSLILSLPVVIWTYVDWALIKPLNVHLYMFLLTSIVVFWCGREFFTRTWSGLKRKTANMDTLVALGVSAAWIYSTISAFLLEGQPVFFETAALLTTFILFGRYLEAITKGRASGAIKKLLQLQSGTALVERDGEEEEIPIEEVEVGDVVVVKPGWKVPVDGTVVDGHSYIDESMVTGESIPVEKHEGDEVIGGTINRKGAFKFKAEKVGKDTVLQNIIELVEEAQSSSPPIEKLADKVAAYFVPSVIVLALLVFLSWLIFGPSFVFALTVGISVLVIACPCAMGLATPTAVMVGTGAGAENGILIKSGEALEVIGKLDTVVVDKTGTLTKGNFKVTDIAVSKMFDPKVTLKYAAIAEKRSEHPLAEAVLEKAEKMEVGISDPKSFENVQGKGVIAETTGKTIKVGSKTFMRKEGIRLGSLEKKVAEFENSGKTVLVVAVDDEAAGAIAVSDELKKNSKKAVSTLKKMGL